MPLFGTLKTMPLPDVLQWLAAARMTGVLQVEHDKVSKSITLSDGKLVGCSSEDPRERLGQFLVARGKLSEDQLREALKLHEDEGRHLGLIIVEMGILTQEELISHLEAKAEEIIFSLFDWEEAVFRFQQEKADQQYVFPVNMHVEDVLLRGLKRVDEIKQIREVFDNPGIVLRRTSTAPPRDVFENEMARKIYGVIDGERTVAEILLHVHGSQYTVTKFLFGLHRKGCVEIASIKDLAGPNEKPAECGEEAVPPPDEQTAESQAGGASDPPLLIDIDLPAEPPAATEEPLSAAVEPSHPTEASVTVQIEATSETAVATAQAPAAEQPILDPALLDLETGIDQPLPDVETGQLELLEQSDTHTLERRLERAGQLMAQSEYEPALEVLDKIYQDYPGDESLRRLTMEAEMAFIEKAYRHYLPPHKIAHLSRSMESLESENLSPTEFFLLSRIDGTWDLKSIIQIAPLREVDVLRTLKRMREKGMIDLKDPQ